MIRQCKHCGTPFIQSKGVDGFCCAGCAQVYGLIQRGGLADFYTHQDMAGHPVGDPLQTIIDSARLHRIQQQAESAGSAHLDLVVHGMSCAACAWLIEQLALRQKGLSSVRVSLDSRLIRLSWNSGAFDLCGLVEELARYGYTITGEIPSTALTLSPQAIRLGLALIFSCNGLLLDWSARSGWLAGSLVSLTDLLLLGCLIFSLMLGGLPVLRSFWRGLIVKRLNKYTLPALLLILLFSLAVSSLLIPGSGPAMLRLYFISLPLLLFVQWCAARWQLERTA